MTKCNIPNSLKGWDVGVQDESWHQRVGRDSLSQSSFLVCRSRNTSEVTKF